MCRALLLLPMFACDDAAMPARALPDYVEDAQEHAVVWNGFTQAWGYNHRLNSLGDYVGPLACEDDACTADLVHTAASGSGSDTARWQAHHTLVTAPKAGFRQGATLLTFADEEGEGVLLRESVTERVPAEGLLAGRGAYTAVLGGFDVYSTDDADKVQRLELGVGDVTVDGDALVFDVEVALRLDCDSPECDGARKLDHSMNYEVMLAWLVVGADDLAVTDLVEEHGYAWEDGRDGIELDVDALAWSSVAEVRPGWAVATTALRRLAVDLDKQHHMAEWASAVVPSGHDADAGTLTYDVRLLFKQWNQGTADYALSYTDQGWGTVTADVAVLQLGRGCTEQGSGAGRITWIADGGPPDDDAVERVPVEYRVAPACRTAEPPRR